jgi:hypothetical protein
VRHALGKPRCVTMLRDPGAGRPALRAAAFTLAAVVASFLCVYSACSWCGAKPGPAILAALVALSAARRPPAAGRAHAFVAPLAMVCVAPAAAGIGLLLHSVPFLGAGVFVATMFLSIWLRNFGARARTAGALIALPLVGILIVPARAEAPGGPAVDIALVVLAGLVPLAVVSLLRRFVRLAGPDASALAAEGAPLRETETSERARRGGLTVPTRMALQMAVALGAAFVLGFRIFPAHWGWAVLTAFIVCSGARGRGDAAYKAILRLLGAAGGTLAAALLLHVPTLEGPLEALATFGVLFVGLWLRERNYAYWAACMTLVLALLAPSSHGLDFGLLGERLEAILAGAACGVAAAWFVVPIRTEAVVRRRLADALVALDDVAAHVRASDEDRIRKLAVFEARMAELASVAPPLRWHRRLFAFADHPEHPARWIDLAFVCREDAHAFGAARDAELRRAAVRKAIGASRRALANHGTPDAAAGGTSVSVALKGLHATFDSRRD